MTRTVSDRAFFESRKGQHDSVDLKALLRMGASRWYWMLAALLVACMTGWLYFRLAPSRYTAQVTLKYLERHSELDELGQSRPAYLFTNNHADYLTEKFNVKSQAVVEDAVGKLNHPFTFYRIKDFRKIDVYPFQALKTSILHYQAKAFTHGTFILDPDLTLHYHSETFSRSWKLIGGETIRVPGLSFHIDRILTAPGYQYRFLFNDPSLWAKILSEDIKMAEVEEAMPVMHLSFTHTNPEFTQDFLRHLIRSYQDFDLLKKQHSHDISLAFIRQQLTIYADSMRHAAQKLEAFKESQGMLTLSDASQSLLSQQEVLTNQLQKLQLQGSFLDMIKENISRKNEPVPALSLGLDASTESSFTAQLNQYNQILFRRKELLLTHPSQAPQVLLLDGQLSSLQTQIHQSLLYQQDKNQVASRLLEQQIGTVRQQLVLLPQLEKNRIYLQSNFDINQRIYNLLRDKEIESSIIRAGILPTFALITALDLRQDAPQPWQIGGLSLLTGLILGVSALLLARSRQLSFESLHHFDYHKDIPLWAVLHRYKGRLNQTPIDLIRLGSDRSIFTEAVNLLRSRISLEIPVPQKNSVGLQILVTSQMAGEGKTFVSLNLALSLVRLGKSVLLIGADLRKPQLGNYFPEADLGMSEFLQADRRDYQALIHRDPVTQIDYIDAGSPPQQPGELLQSPSFPALLTYFKQQYQYVVIDSAPLGLVADTLPLVTSSDVTLFVVRWLRSHRHVLAFARQISRQYPTANLKVILNAYYSDPLYEPYDEQHRHKEMKAQYGLEKYGTKGYVDEMIKLPWYRKFLCF
ncbi:polysaccharide biosynthesis tyrosine autokinase [Dyadobacter tibetensis]|uniref:polysaccharide biosynthesis tyrosine autokinase n=1 Tax=Dyadobacter tibetensis TaxID=1211851 RepID=UPI00046EAFD5|nr:hypothetical protein [Dyadobacter tibetensis]